MKKKIIVMTLFLLIIDLITKILINNNFELFESKVIIPNFFAITKVYNEGASWNILSGYRFLLILISLLILLILFIYQRNFKMHIRNVISFSLLYAGIIGNLIDRILYGHVIDFLDFKILSYDYPVFNFADIWIVCGLFLLIIAILKKEDLSGNSSRKK